MARQGRDNAEGAVRLKTFIRGTDTPHEDWADVRQASDQPSALFPAKSHLLYRVWERGRVRSSAAGSLARKCTARRSRVLGQWTFARRRDGNRVDWWSSPCSIILGRWQRRSRPCSAGRPSIGHGWAAS